MVYSDEGIYKINENSVQKLNIVTDNTRTLKENIINATPKLQDLLKLKVRNFNFIGKDEKLLGFIAQEFEEVFPNAINTDTGFGDMNGKKVVKTTVLIPMLVKAIQEQQTLITELQEKLERNNIT
jgi:UDP-glucose 4-epimerase